MNEDLIEELSPRAEIFRSKLIEDFQLLDMLMDKGGSEAPTHYSNEILDDAVMEKLLKESPLGLVKFQLYSKKDEQRFHDRRLNRVKNKNSIPLGPWAHTVVVSKSNLFNHLFFYLQLSQLKDESLDTIKVALNVFDYCVLTVFVLEIIVKWVDEFWSFWSNGWNVFDFFVTIMSVVPEVMKFWSGTTSELAVIAENLRVFRILRSLKMVSRFAQLRIIVLTILKAFKSMAFIMILLSTFMYIFGVAGTVIFDTYSKSSRTDLKYKESFSTLGNALITLFQLFTLDHWYQMLTDLVKVADDITAKIYVILWICIGAFIFRNIFAGIMVMNFQNIRDDFNKQVKEQQLALEAEQMRQHLTEELDRQDKLHTRTRRSSSAGFSLYNEGAPKIAADVLPTLAEITGSEEDEENKEESTDTQEKENPFAALGSFMAKLKEARSSQTSGTMGGFASIQDDFRKVSDDWNATVEANLSVLKNNPVETLWPRASLFRYFQLMEFLQENIAERQQLLKMAVDSVSQN
ncbi:cation channel sperm-associated protein 2 [Exaiptasia diaphana]|uniref:Ion transport domain-containing protein n=1 Tax=Exaiptasia diaphana TaxID=2652724 RepID=A0A913XHM1_EXADI|nr:cation channel sperm-associated protein 2 [Exaiptasia diaphana]